MSADDLPLLFRQATKLKEAKYSTLVIDKDCLFTQKETSTDNLLLHQTQSPNCVTLNLSKAKTTAFPSKSSPPTLAKC